MGKIKTHQGAKKRVKRTGSGKMLRGRAFANHNFEKKSPARKRRSNRQSRFADSDKNNVKRLLGK